MGKKQFSILDTIIISDLDFTLSNLSVLLSCDEWTERKKMKVACLLGCFGILIYKQTEGFPPIFPFSYLPLQVSWAYVSQGVSLRSKSPSRVYLSLKRQHTYFKNKPLEISKIDSEQPLIMWLVFRSFLMTHRSFAKHLLLPENPCLHTLVSAFLSECCLPGRRLYTLSFISYLQASTSSSHITYSCHPMSIQISSAKTIVFFFFFFLREVLFSRLLTYEDWMDLSSPPSTVMGER